MLLNANQVKTLLNVSENMAYKSIRILNSELKEKGYLTIRGRIPADYIIKRYGLNVDDLEIVKEKELSI